MIIMQEKLMIFYTCLNPVVGIIAVDSWMTGISPWKSRPSSMHRLMDKLRLSTCLHTLGGRLSHSSINCR